MNKMQLIEKDYLKKDVSKFNVGDAVQVHTRVKEGDKTRTQIFAGVVIRKRGSGISATFSVLRDVQGEIVEKVFPVHSPNVEKVVVTKKGSVRRARLYYMRKKKVGTA